MPLIKSGSRQAVSTNIREMMAAGHPQKQAIAAALSTARRYAARGGRQEEPDLPALNYLMTRAVRSATPRPAEAQVPLGQLNRAGQFFTGDRADKEMYRNEISARSPKRPESAIPPTFEERWRGAPQQPRFIDDEYGRAQNVYRRGGMAYASGGDIMPWQERASGRALIHAGMIKSPVPGRTDQLPITVGGGAYVLPADHVAALGQNNSTAGANILDSMFKKGTYGAPRSAKPRMPRFGMRRKMFAEGGAPDHDKPVQIIAAGGEYVVPPEVVAELGGGDLDHGHSILDNWVKATRRKHIKTLRGLKPPKQS